MELKKYKLGDVATIIVGYPFESERFNTEGKGILLVRGMNVSERYLRFGEEARWWDEITDKYLPYYLQENDVLIGMDGSKVGKNFAIVKKEDLPLLLVQRVACIRAKSGFDQHFIWQYVSSPRFIEYVNTIKTGSSIPHISGSQIANFPIFAPSFEIQKRIGSLLSNLDRKIALNRAINRNLEALAKQLYDYWFVQFDFPDENGRPYKSSGGKMVWNKELKREIPEGWVASNICKIADILSGGTPCKSIKQYWEKGNLPFFGPTDYNGNVFQIDTADHITQEGLDHCASSLFEEGVVIITARGSIGKLVIVGKPMAMNQSCYALRAKNHEYEYLYFLTIQLIDCLKAKGSGSVFKSIISSDIENSLLCLAVENVIKEFCQVIKPIFQTIKENTVEIFELTKQRDELLPLLMNGQVTIE